MCGAAAPAGGTARVFVGGVITEYLTWPRVFFINVPIAVAILAVVPSVMPAGNAAPGRRVDLLGAVLATAGLAATDDPADHDRHGRAGASRAHRGWAQGATVSGLVLLAAGMAWLALVNPDGSYAVDVLPASLVAALGMSLAFIPTLGTTISAAPPSEGGLASGIVNTSYQIGSALGLAVMTTVAAANGADQIGNKTALPDGFSAAFLGAAIVAGVGVIATLALFRSPAAGTTEVDDTADKVAV